MNYFKFILRLFFIDKSYFSCSNYEENMGFTPGWGQSQKYYI